MKLSPLVLAAALLATTAGRPQQMPAGTRDAADHSREQTAGANVQAAEAALEHGDFAAAVTILEPLVAAHPKSAQLAYDLGFAQERLNHDERAAQAYAAASAADPAYAEPRLALALLQARAGHTAEARAGFAAVASLPGAPADLRARALRGLAQLDSAADPATASSELLEAIKLTGETPVDTQLSAALAARSGDSADAAAEYRRLLAAHPDDADAASGFAHLQLQANQPAAAQDTLLPALTAHPDDVRLLSQMASALAMQGRTADAIAALEKVRAQQGNATAPAVLRQMARLYGLDGQEPQAEALYREVLAQQPDDPTLMDDLGSTLVRAGKYAEAEAVLKRAVALREGFPTPADFGDAAAHLAFAASKNNDPQVCLQALAIRATVLPNSAPSLFLQATAYDTLRQYKPAKEAYKAFLAAAAGKFPDQEFQARHRLVALDHMR